MKTSPLAGLVHWLLLGCMLSVPTGFLYGQSCLEVTSDTCGFHDDLGTRIEYSDWEFHGECQCGTSFSVTRSSGYSYDASFGVTLGFLTANLGVSPPPIDSPTFTCDSSDCENKALFTQRRIVRMKKQFHRRTCTPVCDPPMFPGDPQIWRGNRIARTRHCGFMYYEWTYRTAQTNVVHCTSPSNCQWETHPCKPDCCPKDTKTGNCLPLPEDCCADHVDKSGQPITYPRIVEPNTPPVQDNTVACPPPGSSVISLTQSPCSSQLPCNF